MLSTFVLYPPPLLCMHHLSGAEHALRSGSGRTPSLRCLACVQCSDISKLCPALQPRRALLWASDAHGRFSMLPGGVQGAGGISQCAAAGQR